MTYKEQSSHLPFWGAPVPSCSRRISRQTKRCSPRGSNRY